MAGPQRSRRFEFCSRVYCESGRYPCIFGRSQGGEIMKLHWQAGSREKAVISVSLDFRGPSFSVAQKMQSNRRSSMIR